MTSADWVGYAATVVGTAMMMPQLVKSWRTKHMRDVAFGTVILFVLNCALWETYAVMISAQPMIVANIIGFFIGLALLTLKLRFHQN
jgi:MtN3 and saliva related transmembrane protein